MNDKARKLVGEIAKLPVDDQVRVVEQVLELLNGKPDATTAKVWAREIARRSAECDDGSVDLVPWSGVQATAQRKLRDG